MMAWVEARVGDHLGTVPQNPWLWHFRQEQGRQGVADADDAEQQVTSAAQVAVLLNRLGNGLVDHLELAAESVNHRLRHLDCRAVAKTAAEAVFPFRPVGNQPGAHGLQFAQPPHRRGWWRPWLWPEKCGVLADQGGIGFVGLVAAKLATGEVTDLRGVDNTDSMTRIVPHQSRTKTVTAGRFHTNMGGLAAFGLEPGQHLFPAIGAVFEDPGLLALALRITGVQGLLGHVDSNDSVVHVSLPFQAISTARLRIRLPCTRDQRMTASL